MSVFRTSFAAQKSERWARAGSVLIGVAAVALFTAAVFADPSKNPFPSFLLIVVLVLLAVAIGIHVGFLLLAYQERNRTADTLVATEREYKSVFEHVLDGVVILDDRRICLDANPAAVRLLGTSSQELVGDSIDSLFPDNDGFKESWGHLLKHSFEQGETRALRGDGAFAFVEYTVKANFLPGRHVAVLRDVTQRKQAEVQMARNLDAAEAARAEAEAFRKAGLALTQDLSMDYVLDTLLRSLLDLVPCESAQVILFESETRLFLAREVERTEAKRRLPDSPLTFEAKDGKFFLGALASPKGLLISDTRKESEWSFFKGFTHLGSWLCVPLVASDRVLGFLSLGDLAPEALSSDHLRLAQSLAIPAAVAIQNARLYEQAEIFRIELEQRLVDVQYSKDEAAKRSARLS